MVGVVAGPGHRFYATDRLSRGTKVQIYREEPSGWLAIRPPEGSFSWTPAEFVERLEDGTRAASKKPWDRGLARPSSTPRNTARK